MGITCVSTFPAQQNLQNPQKQVEECEVLDTSLGPSVDDTQAMTRFAGEACSTVSIYGTNTTPTFSYPQSSVISDVRRFVERPRQISNVTVAGTAGTQIIAYTINSVALSPFFGDNFNFTAGVRFTMRFRLQVAATPFAGGVMKMYYMPVTTVNTPVIPTQNEMSKIPGVYLDINEQTMAVLDVPWINVYDYIPVPASSSAFSAGTIYVSMFTSLNNLPANGTPTMTLWMSLHDVQLVGAGLNTGVSNLVPQAGNEDVAVTRPISSLLMASGKYLSSVGRSIPYISSYVTPPAWFAYTLGKVAASFGFSKPYNSVATKRVVNTFNALQQNVDGADTVTHLGNCGTNSLVPMPGFAGNDVDEMAMAYVLGQEAVICRFGLATTNTVGTLKYAAYISPTCMYFYSSTLGLNLTSNMNRLTATPQAMLTTPISFLANIFGFWKGGMTFRFISNKTKFHAGRLLFAFLPLPNTRPPASNTSRAPTDLADSTMLHSAVWDLASSNSFEFEVPYISPTPYTPVSLGTGYLNVTVLDPLIGVSTVSSTIEITVFVRASPDFEFAQPLTNFLPIVDSTVALVAQSGGPMVSTTRDDDCIYCIGEKINSVKQLCSKAGYFATFDAVASPVAPWHNVLVGPVRLTSAFSVSWTGLAQPYYYYLSSMYNFFRGSSCMDFILKSNTGFGSGYSLAVAYNNYIRDGNQSRGMNSHITEQVMSHVRFPYMDLTSRSLVQDQSMAAAPTDGVQISLTPSYSTACIANSQVVTAYVRAGDDFQLGYWYNTPRLGFGITGQANAGFSTTISLVPAPPGT